MVEIDNRQRCMYEVLFYLGFTFALWAGAGLFGALTFLGPEHQDFLVFVFTGVTCGGCAALMTWITVRTIKRLVWELQLDHDGVTLHFMTHHSRLGWEELDRLIVGNVDMLVPIGVVVGVPIVSSQSYLNLSMKTKDGFWVSARVSSQQAELIQLLRVTLHEDGTEHLATLTEFLKSAPLPVVKAIYWSHFGNGPQVNGTQAELLIDGIVRHVVWVRKTPPSWRWTTNGPLVASIADA